jgi:lipoprotein-anchoring transpeptidase ErfK/SrfK
MPEAQKALKIFVSVTEQRIYLLAGSEVVASYPCSTSSIGLGTEEGSHRTPTGHFRVAEKVGDGASLGAVFKGRVPTGEIAQEGAEGDLITSRILWLDGLDADNGNTKRRYIYFHGTNHETEIGKPDSHGCVRMRNVDVVELYEQVVIGTQVLIAS